MGRSFASRRCGCPLAPVHQRRKGAAERAGHRSSGGSSTPDLDGFDGARRWACGVLTACRENVGTTLIREGLGAAIQLRTVFVPEAQAVVSVTGDRDRAVETLA